MSSMFFYTHRFHEQQFRGSSSLGRGWYLGACQVVQHEMNSYMTMKQKPLQPHIKNIITMTVKLLNAIQRKITESDTTYNTYLPWAKLKSNVSRLVCSFLEAYASFAWPFRHCFSNGFHGFDLLSWMEYILKKKNNHDQFNCGRSCYKIKSRASQPLASLLDRSDVGGNFLLQNTYE